MTYFNTTGESGEELKRSRKAASTQQDLILAHFKQTGEQFSPSMILSALALNCPITSVRRAMTNLTASGELLKTPALVRGLYGKQEHLWALPAEPEVAEQRSLF